MNFDRILQKIIVILFSLLFFLVPLFFTSVNSELFEFNKIILVYGFTTLITGAWIGRMLVQKKFIFKHTLFDIPLGLFLLSQILSTIFSIDPHTSLFGYYSRFNGGLLSTICYLLLFWAITCNCEPKNIILFLKVSLATAVIASIYGIFEHFGHSFSCLMFTGSFDVACWVQDVKNRVFATIGQPNWLATYLAVLIPVVLGFIVSKKQESRSKNQAFVNNNLILYSLFFILYSCLLFTGSRSGFAGLAIGLFIFWISIILTNKDQIKSFLKPFLILNFLFLILIFIFGSPFSQINHYFSLSSLRSLISHNSPVIQTTSNTANPSPQLEVGGSESGAIRKIVWKGAIDIFKHFPLLGSGVETFAYSYYNFRPMEHNLVSEWDFLYNKAHNEFLNYLATTGAVGLGTYLLFIVTFVIFTIKKLKANSEELKTKVQNLKLSDKFLVLNYGSSLFALSFSLFCGWLCILVSNFFGFSVVVVSLYFFLIPAFAIVLSKEESTNHQPPTTNHSKIPFAILLCTLSFVLWAVINYWRADYYYAIGLRLNKQNQLFPASETLLQAIANFPKEPVYQAEISVALANTAYISFVQNDLQTASKTAEMAIKYSDSSINISPKNFNLWKTRVKILYTLSQFDKKYYNQVVKALNQSRILAPTDPKIILNLGVIYSKNGDLQKGLQLIEKAIKMKPNYEEARSILAAFYEELGDKQKALEQFENILKYNRPNDQNLKEKIEKLKR